MVKRQPRLPTVAPLRERSFRLRHLLLLLCMATVASWLYPRVRAAFELHSLGTAAGDYGACMVGPTGPAALRDNPTAFAGLVRRRLVASGAESFPFAECATLAGRLSGSHEVARAHGGRADEYLEYGGRAGVATRSLSQLSFALVKLKQLASAAWPLERRGYSHLIQPSSHAKEAPHPVAPNPPAPGTGLPGWRAAYVSGWKREHTRFVAFGHAAVASVFESRDGGFNWYPASADAPGVAQHLGRCTGADSPRSFSFELAESEILVQSMNGEHAVSVTRVPAVRDVVATSCDDDSMLLAAQGANGKELFLCLHAGRCGRLPHDKTWLEGAFDVARVAGAVVIATARSGIVRVRSTRDQGKTWTPDTVAFDWAAQPIGTDVKVPSRLLSLGNELWLFGAGERGQSYPVLYSLDMGASWYAPRRAEASNARASR